MLVSSDRSWFTPFAPFVFNLLAQLRQSKYIHALWLCKIREKSMGLERHQHAKDTRAKHRTNRKNRSTLQWVVILPFLAIVTLYYKVCIVYIERLGCFSKINEMFCKCICLKLIDEVLNGSQNQKSQKYRLFYSCYSDDNLSIQTLYLLGWTNRFDKHLNSPCLSGSYCNSLTISFGEFVPMMPLSFFFCSAKFKMIFCINIVYS